MNKEVFLKELSERLHVLNEKERQDVLEEYEQHIDLKIESGLSEEEAVRDFGTPEELCEELLDAYHINSEYASGVTGQEHTEGKLSGKVGTVWKHVRQAGSGESGEKKMPFAKIPVFSQKKKEEAESMKTEEELLQEQEEKRKQEEERQKQLWEKQQHQAELQQERKKKREACLQKKKLQREENLLKREQKRAERKERMVAFQAERRQMRLEREALRSQYGGSWIGRAIHQTGALLISFLLLCWKLCLFGAAVPFLVFAAMALFCTGAVLVLFLQGYPLLGITLLGAGAFLTTAGISGLLLSYVFTGKCGEDRGKREVFVKVPSDGMSSGNYERTVPCDKEETE